ncbi:MAG: MFS transporter [Nocardiopsaceae bacterium]|nr:MFS transporter [Nocardiopsaceae bacterium]
MPRLGALGDPRFRRLFAGQALSSFGDSALYLTLGIWAKTLTGSNAAAGGVFLALAAPALFAPLAGQLADRVRRKTLLLAVNAATALVVLSLVFVRSRNELWLIYAVAFCYGTSFGLLSAAGAGLRKDMLRGEDLASANALLQMSRQGLRVLSPLVGSGLFVAFGGPAVAVFDAVTFGGAIAALASLRVAESEAPRAPRAPRAPWASRAPRRGDNSNKRGRGGGPFSRDTVFRRDTIFWRDTGAGFRHIRAVPLLVQLALVSAIAFGITGLGETIIYAVVGEGLHRPAAFMGVVLSVQGAGSIAGGLTAAYLMRRAGAARTVGLALACFALASLAYRTSSLALVLAATVGDGLGVVWLSVGLFTAMQWHTPPRLQGRVNGAVNTLLNTPQTVLIAAGAALIGVVSYRLMLLVMAVVIGGCAAWLLARPAPAPPPESAPPPPPESVALSASLTPSLPRRRPGWWWRALRRRPRPRASRR